MSLLETIRTDALEARKNSDPVAKNLLITLLSEAEMVGKNAGNRESTDEETTVVIRKFLKNINETLAPERVLAGSYRLKLEVERDILNRYVPQELTRDALRAAILAEVGTGLTVKDTGRVKAVLEAKYPGQVSGKVLSDVLKAGV